MATVHSIEDRESKAFARAKEKYATVLGNCGKAHAFGAPEEIRRFERQCDYWEQRLGIA